MRRVLEFGVWKEEWWKALVGARVDEDDALMEGMRAYALEHAQTEREFRETLEVKWAGIRLRTKAVLEDLERPVFSETPSDDCVVVDIDHDTDDSNGGTGDWLRNAEDEEEVEEMIA